MAPHESSALSRAVDHTLASAASASLPEVPPPAEVTVSRHEEAIVVRSDGTSVAIELSEPLRLGAAELAEELSGAINEALQEAQIQSMAQIESVPELGALQRELDSLREELTSAYDDELRGIDARIAKLAES